MVKFSVTTDVFVTVCWLNGFVLITLGATESGPTWVVKLEVNGTTLFPARSCTFETATLITALSGRMLIGVISTSVALMLPVPRFTKLMLIGAIGVAVPFTSVVIWTVLVDTVSTLIGLLNRTCTGAFVPTPVLALGGVIELTCGCAVSLPVPV